MSVQGVALVTGASSGIGEATARALAKKGWRLVLVARREERLLALAAELGGASVLALDLTESGAPSRVADLVRGEHGALHLLVNNAGAAWRGTFEASGWANVERHMKLNFEAPVRLTQALLPLLRETAAARPGGGVGEHAGVSPRISIVNVASTAGRVSRAGSGAYSASKFALIGWSDALTTELRPQGIHVGLVLPGFVETEGFPARELTEKALTRWLVSKPEVVAEAILEAGPGDRAERYVPRPYWLAAASRILLPGLVRRATGGGALTMPTGTRD
ncbi:MAG: SDR family NAD(P)-dependent oxidoreductase [Solirubrobacteraceae bacterium]